MCGTGWKVGLLKARPRPGAGAEPGTPPTSERLAEARACVNYEGRELMVQLDEPFQA